MTVGLESQKKQRTLVTVIEGGDEKRNHGRGQGIATLWTVEYKGRNVCYWMVGLHYQFRIHLGDFILDKPLFLNASKK